MMEKQTFNELGIKPEILEVLSKLKFTTPTPIQHQAIPVAIEGNDVIGIAQTGTGKTLAFGVPAIQKLLNSKDSALIILPTRELAIQVDESLGRIARHFNLRSAVLIGGQNINKQIHDLKANPKIIISTPGRLIDHLERKTVKLDRIGILVLDEADRMLDMGFEPQVKRIMQEVPKARQTMLFSATMPTEIVGLANKYMKTPLRVEVAPAGSATDNVTHEIFFVKEGSKLALLESVIKGKTGSILVFSRTKFGAKRIASSLRRMGYTSTEIHSNRTLSQRMSALNGFKKGKFQIMVATDIAARGIDVKGIELVVNYDLPDCPEDYVHRIGRTGRATNLGHAISFATPRQTYDIRCIEKLIKKHLPVSQLPELQDIKLPAMKNDSDKASRAEREMGRGRNNERRQQNRPASDNRYGKNSKFSSGRKDFEASKSHGRNTIKDSRDQHEKREDRDPFMYKYFVDTAFAGESSENFRNNRPSRNNRGAKRFDTRRQPAKRNGSRSSFSKSPQKAFAKNSNSR